MTNQEAADLIRRAIAEIEWEQPMEYAAAFDKAIEVLKAAPAKWISCKGGLPKVGQKVLILSRFGHVFDAQLDYTNSRFVFDPLGYEPDRDVKCWMPMPEEPGEG